jgi:hypothetical protein
MPLLLKIREVSLYGVIRTFLADATDNWYVNKFMQGRRSRLLADAPYLALDF